MALPPGLNVWQCNVALFMIGYNYNPGVNFINMLTCSFYMCRFQKCKTRVKSSVEKKLTDLLCCCTAADLRFTQCAQVWWNWPQVFASGVGNQWLNSCLTLISSSSFFQSQRKRFDNGTKAFSRIVRMAYSLSRCQFHQHFMSSFFIQKSFEQFFCTYILGLYFFGKRKLAQKLCVTCWWNWLQGFVKIYTQFFPNGDPTKFASLVFRVFDENHVRIIKACRQS